MDDLISRQEAIDALARVAREKFNLSDEFTHYLAGLMDGENAIRQLPTAQPEILACGEGELNVPDTNVGDMISRQAAIDSIAKQMPRSYTPDGSHPGDEEIFRAQEIYVDCIESIEILPAVQPEIIRCKDCEHWKNEHLCESLSRFGSFETKADFYCGYAERKTDG